MKKPTKKSPVKKPTRASTVQKKRTALVKARPLQKRILLHPFSVMVLLCAGVLIAGLTLPGFADTLEVRATVEAPIITAPATITSPLPQQHSSSPAVAVTGGCSAQSYVKLNVNSVFSGMDTCQSGVYTIPATLKAGTNQLQVQVYNLTDLAGPSTAPLTVYYDQIATPPPPAPAAVPTTLQVAGVEKMGYPGSGQLLQTSDNPTISGYAPPYSVVTVTFHSAVSTCVTVADGAGWWTCTLDHTLPIGIHHVDISAVSTAGEHMTVPTFEITVLASLANLLVPATTISPAIRTNYNYQARRPGQAFSWNFTIEDGQAPYAVTIDWGDGTNEHFIRPDRSTFTVTHAYQATKDFAVTVTAVDAQGSITRFQVVAIVNSLVTGTGTISGGAIGSLLGGLRQRLWLIWPAYIVVVLMVVGYWLGEREEYQYLMNQRRARGHSAARGKQV